MAKRPCVYGELGLTEQQEEFAVLVASGLEPSAAYRKAYATGAEGRDVHRISTLAAKLVSHKKVRARIRELLEPVMKERNLTVQRIAHSVANALYCDPAEMFDAKGNLLSFQDMPVRVRDAIEGFEMKDGALVKVKLSSKATAREQAMRYRGMFEKDNAQKFGTMSDEQLEERLAKLIGADAQTSQVLAKMREQSEIPKDW
jgi:hypothetical protein